MAITTVPNAREIMPRSAIVNGASPLTMSVAGTDPTPMNTRKAVPMASAPKRWNRFVSSSMAVPLPIFRILFDIVECDLGSYSCGSLLRKSFREIGHIAEGTAVIQSVDRAIRVLTALQGARRMSLSELAARLDLAPSTTHGIVRSLVEHGMVVQERGSSRYQLGPAVLRLGNVYLDTLELRSKAIPWAEDLARRTGLAVRTGVLLIDDVVIIHHEPRPDGSRQMPEVGIVIPVHASALGKAMLAFLRRGRETRPHLRRAAQHDR